MVVAAAPGLVRFGVGRSGLYKKIISLLFAAGYGLSSAYGSRDDGGVLKACSSMVERCHHRAEAGGSIPSAPKLAVPHPPGKRTSWKGVTGAVP